jgi:ketol-acid reductoisomerase
MNKPSAPNSAPKTNSEHVSHADGERDRRRIAVVGYGEGEGREHAKRLRDDGHDVAVAVFPGGLSWVHAVHDGFRPMRAWEAVVGADIVVLLVPDEELEAVYWEQIAPAARPGTLLVFTRANDLEADQFPPGCDVAQITVSEDGCLFAIRQDATGEARGRALAYLQWLGNEVPRSTASQIRVREPNDPFPHPMRRVL